MLGHTPPSWINLGFIIMVVIIEMISTTVRTVLSLILLRLLVRLLKKEKKLILKKVTKDNKYRSVSYFFLP